MAATGFFTYRDLYGGKPETYHQQRFFELPSSRTVQSLSTSTTTSIPDSTITNPIIFISSTTVQSNSTLHQLAQLVPFAYFHWLLIAFAILLTILLSVIFICYCRTHCRKNNKTYKEKQQSFPNFYRYRAMNPHVRPYDMCESTAIPPPEFPSPKRPCPSRSVERRNIQLLRQGLDAVGSPHIPRIDVSRTEPSSTFTSTASDLLTEIKSRMSTQSSESSLKIDRQYETQRANMALND